MKKICIALVCLLLFCSNAFAETKQETKTEVTPPVEVAVETPTETKRPDFAEPEQMNVENAEINKLTDAFTIKFKNEASLKIYGKIEMLSYYDTTSPFISDWLVYVYPKNTYDGKESSYSMSVRGSPLGFYFWLPKSIGTADLSAKLEMDFVGGYTTGAMGTYSPLMRLKQAWVSIDSKHFGFLAGQTFGLFSPLFPDQASWIALGTSGNPWIRLPQLKFTTRFEPVTIELSVNRPMGANEVFGNQLDDVISDGEQSKMPFFMGRFGYAEKFWDINVSTGVSGVFGKEKIHREETVAGTAFTLDKTLNVWMVGYDLKLVSKYVDFLGEFFIGDNLNTFFAGILQGVYIDVPTNVAHGIRDMGGWAQITIKPTEKIYASLAAGIDKPTFSDLTATTSRTSNFTAFSNVNYRFNKWFNAGLEVSYMRTGYRGNNTNSNIRGLLRTSFVF